MINNSKIYIIALNAIVVLCFYLAPTVRAEFTCTPQNEDIKYRTENDKYFKTETKKWREITRDRYLEGDGKKSCELFPIANYEGFPVYKCSYKSADEGTKYFDPIEAKVLILNPSAKQLASWSIHACRINGSTDFDMPECLQHIRSFIIDSNGAQFPIAGSVVESICNSSELNGPCKKKSLIQHDIQNLVPRNTLFKDGVAIHIVKISEWEKNKPISDDTYKKLFDVTSYDNDITFWGEYSRVSGATRWDWKKWRQHINKPIALEGYDSSEFNIKYKGWQIISREVHKSACMSEANELFDAIVYSHNWQRHK